MMASSGSKRALVSVSDKTALAPFASALTELGFEIVSTGGTRRFLEENGVPVLDVSAYTGFPEIMEGRVKTLHPKIHGALLGRPDRPGDAAAIAEHEIVPFQILICNLYPFEKTVAEPTVALEDAIEQIDVGGPSMVRAAAKNNANVAVITDPAQYAPVLERLRSGGLTAEFRLELAQTAFERTSQYDRAIADYLAAQATANPDETEFPKRLTLSMTRSTVLRYGENPHQRAALYVDPRADASSLAAAEVLHGKELSYNNYLDLDAARSLAREFSGPAAVIIKHNNPCGCGIGTTLRDAFVKAHAGDPVSAFGSIMGFNRPLDAATADAICQPDRFVEAILAPDYEPDALAILCTRAKWAKSLRLLKCPQLLDSPTAAFVYRGISGGMLVQGPDEVDKNEAQRADWRVVTKRCPTEPQLADLSFAWLVAKHVKSNAIVFAAEDAVVGVGAGQMSRVDSVQIAVSKSAGRSQGAVLASDAFFPFRDGVDAAIAAGIAAIVQPGGSRRDDEVIAACDDAGIAMLFTGRRHFRH
jgi:phosphoribosylaminoimidazolecarboxamide formyltransferase/IMP cyclohydrolase